jgi:carbamoyl-phosphate synthase large subunit
LGFAVLATTGTADRLEQAGLSVTRLRKIAEGHPNLIDYLKNEDVHLIINTPSGKGARTDEGKIRATAVQYGVSCITTITATMAAIQGMEAERDRAMSVQSLQDRYAEDAPVR